MKTETPKLDKSPERLAMEIKGKSRIDAEGHLVKYGAPTAGAAAAVALNVGHSSQKVTGSINEIARDISDNC